MSSTITVRCAYIITDKHDDVPDRVYLCTNLKPDPKRSEAVHLKYEVSHGEGLEWLKQNFPNLQDEDIDIFLD